jgi:glycosyltransferase involved in cell wall biosynthesis
VNPTREPSATAGGPEIGIVLPSRNGSRYLASALESLESQSERRWSLVVVDDGSTDDTSRIAASFADRDPRIRVVRNDQARGLPASLNRGFEESRAEWLTWTSDDNLHRPRALERLGAVLSREPDVDVVYADYTVIDAQGTAVEAKHLPSIQHLGYSNIVGPCFLFRRRVLEALGGYSETLFLAEDYDFWLRAVPRFRFLHLEEDLYLYRIHAAGLGSSRRAEVLLATERALRGNVSRLSQAMRYEAYERLRELALARGDRRTARRDWFSALRNAPVSAIRAAIRRVVRTRS